MVNRLPKFQGPKYRGPFHRLFHPKIESPQNRIIAVIAPIDDRGGGVPEWSTGSPSSKGPSIGLSRAAKSASASMSGHWSPAARCLQTSRDLTPNAMLSKNITGWRTANGEHRADLRATEERHGFEYC